MVGQFTPIVTDEYDTELIDLCHQMLSVVYVKEKKKRKEEREKEE
jgi:hypothetical protein